MQFADLCAFFQKVKDTKGANSKLKLAEEHFKKFKPKSPSEETFFPILRLIVPKFDRERGTYNMKESRISSIFIKMLDLPNGNDKNTLSKSYLASSSICDFADVVYSIIRKYINNTKTTLTITELNTHLDEMVNRKVEKEVETIFLKILKKCSSEDCRWIIRIILKELRLGIDGNRILNCFHKDAANFYSTNNNLKKVCQVLSKSNVHLHELEINVFEAFRPMLSKRIDAATFRKEILEQHPFYIENKFDGERFQLHMQNHIFKYYSRNGFDYTEKYGSTYGSGIFTPKLQATLKNVEQIILDGEMMLWNKNTNKFGSKGMSMDVKKLKESYSYQPCFCVYDILLLNGKVLTNKPLETRLQILKDTITHPVEGTLILSEYKQVNTRQDIINALNSSMDQEEEGIIVKNPKSIYKYSDRNSGWYKMKMEYFSDVMNDLDLILMGACYGSISSKRLNSFFVGVRSGPTYFALGKVSSGLTDEQLDQLNNKFRQHGFKYEQLKSKSNELMFGKKDLPHFCIAPQHSYIFVIRASELIRTTDESYKTPYTFRFPRVLKIRDDKPVDQCLTMNELLELSKQNTSVIKLNKRHLELNEILAVKTKTIKRDKLIMTNVLPRGKVQEIFNELTIYVLSGSPEFDKEAIINMVRRTGGKISYKIDEKVDIILVGSQHAKIKELLPNVHKSNSDIISVTWLKRSIAEGEPMPYQHDEVYGIGCNYKNFLSNEVDMYGDSFTEPATIETLKRTIGIIKDMEETTEIPGNFNFLDQKFRNKVAYFDKYASINNSDSDIIYNSYLDELEFKYKHGQVADKLNYEVNLIVYNGDDVRLMLLREYITNRSLDIKIIKKQALYQ